MTLTSARAPAERSSVEPVPASPPSKPPERPGATKPADDKVRIAPSVAISIGLTAAFLLGFLAYLIAFSGLSETRAQHALRQSLTRSLAAATAPNGPSADGRPIAEGDPVAVLDIPTIGVHSMIVVEGTSSRDLMAGPGHVAATVLPGQPGTSAVLGKRSTFGAPFRSLLKLKIGDEIVATTGQGRNTYVVSSFGDTAHPAPANSANRLLLATARVGWAPGSVVMVSADLKSTVQPSSGLLPQSVDNQAPLARDVGNSLIPLAGWSQLLLVLAVLGTWLLHRGPRWPVLLCLGPITLAVVWSIYENAAGLLPNVL